MKTPGRNKLSIILGGVLILAGLLFSIRPARAILVDEVEYPRLANIFLKVPMTDFEIEMLLKWDVLILGMQIQTVQPEAMNQIRAKNPQVIILAYVAPSESPYSRLDLLESQDGLWHLLYENTAEDWWLYDDTGKHVSFWPGNWSLNITNYAPKVNGERWNTYFPRFLEEEVMSSGLWDGIFFDSVWETTAWANNNNMDLDRDGKRETIKEINDAWYHGMVTIFSEARRRLGDEVIFVGNGGEGYKKYLNGRMYESFPNLWEGGWEGQAPRYFAYMNNTVEPQISIINGDTENSGQWQNWQDMRFALTSTLLDDGFFSYDFGTQDHSQVWWYDEFDAVLGRPITEAWNIYATNPNEVKEGLWRRDFEGGIVLVNSTRYPQTYALDGAFEKLLGTQDSNINSGDLVTSVDLAASDGIILLKRLAMIQGSAFVNGALAKVFDQNGQEVRQSFYSYTGKVEGGKIVIIEDLDGDKIEEIVVASGSRVYINNSDGSLRSGFFPYSQYYQGTINIALGDVDGDGRVEIVTGTGQGAGPHVRIFDYSGKLKNPGFFAYEKHIRHGVRVGVGDLNGDGQAEIVTGPGFGAAPQIRIFEGATGRLLSGGFFAYDSRIRIGVNVGVGDVDADGKAEIVTGAGPGGGPHVRIFDFQGKLESPGFFAYSQSERSGVGIALSDVAGDATKEIITFSSFY